ncbi:hypothetical protein [Niabella ginsengisoli]|uniref:XRE family transcriptional regulator n=1 Tax=Niabella ginsengisoli TaxID=522298 RepID=A0ABS9SRC7_9BACT|nr:hypothetical protein [Niabella ginsengisoli]MCH5600943.1 hypothetical protein [Niabella ginsengisoli]
MNERRGITPYLSIKLAKQFNTANDYFMILQGYEVKKVSDKLEKRLGFSLVQKSAVLGHRYL